jgi:hypothetical protein
MCKNTKYILQKPTPKIKQPIIQLTFSQLFSKAQQQKHKQACLMEHAIGGSALGGGGCASEGRTKRSMTISPDQAVIHDS